MLHYLLHVVELNGSEFSLRDGRIVAIRYIDPSDKTRLAEFHRKLSDRTIHFRHFGHHPELSEKELSYFTTLDHSKREAVVALAADEIVGVARIDKISLTRAEVAMVIRDDYQRQGLGSALFSILKEIAVTLGIEEFTAEVLPQNRAMIRLMEVFGDDLQRTTEDSVVSLTVKIV